MISWALVFVMLITSNFMLTNGFGVVSLERSKSNFWFVLFSSLFMVVVLMSCASMYGVFYTFVLAPYKIEKVGLVLIVLFAGIANFGMYGFIRLTNKELFYYYETTYSFVINFAITIGALLCIDFTGKFSYTAVQAALICLAYVLTTIMFALFSDKLNNQRVSRLFRPVPITIFATAVVSMIIYAISVCV